MPQRRRLAIERAPLPQNARRARAREFILERQNKAHNYADVQNKNSDAARCKRARARTKRQTKKGERHRVDDGRRARARSKHAAHASNRTAPPPQRASDVQILSVQRRQRRSTDARRSTPTDAKLAPRLPAIGCGRLTKRRRRRHQQQLAAAAAV